MNGHAIKRTQHGPRFCGYSMLRTCLGLGRSFTVTAERWARVSRLLTAYIEAGDSIYPKRTGRAWQRNICQLASHHMEVGPKWRNFLHMRPSVIIEQSAQKSFLSNGSCKVELLKGCLITPIIAILMAMSVIPHLTYRGVMTHNLILKRSV